MSYCSPPACALKSTHSSKVLERALFLFLLPGYCWAANRMRLLMCSWQTTYHLWLAGSMFCGGTMNTWQVLRFDQYLGLSLRVDALYKHCIYSIQTSQAMLCLLSCTNPAAAGYMWWSTCAAKTILDMLGMAQAELLVSVCCHSYPAQPSDISSNCSPQSGSYRPSRPPEH